MAVNSEVIHLDAQGKTSLGNFKYRTSPGSPGDLTSSEEPCNLRDFFLGTRFTDSRRVG